MYWSDPEFGYQGASSPIHDTTLGPGPRRDPLLDSTRRTVKPSVDALRLSRGMTYKAAITGLNLGGGKSVIMGGQSSRRTAR